ncbi:MAG: alanine--tRNA ligase [Planctomycetes bacterium]|nr:alanine--tRNA ligase [Planctomycetota bacterium]
MPESASALRTAARIRQEFLDFFAERHGHAFAASSSVVPRDDPTLKFANAGMNQFKDVFLGRGTRPYTRAVNSQKCIRAGGKHNDLEDVGKDSYHHTFFEMLGNWSFGDYFKEEAIEWAWELLTGVWGIDPERLYVTVFEGDANDGLDADEEAESCWLRHVAPERVSRWDRKDNFWEMGETGPCGPCSEIHYDGRPDEDRARVDGATLVNQEHDEVVEIWNLVFIQFNRGDGGTLMPLPARHVDTGMGLERLVRVLQGLRSNYDTDLWTPIFRAISTHTGAHPYQGRFDDPVDEAYRVIADHVRCLTMAITDGCPPGNEDRGYVLRRILRRAVRHAHQTLEIDGPLLCDLVPAVVESLAGAYPELAKNPDRVAGIIRDEEESFLRTLDRGLELFDGAATDSGGRGGVITAEHAFRLHDTYGFPIDLTRVMAEERGMTVDEAGYERRMAEARERSRAGASASDEISLPPNALESLQSLNVRPTRDDDKFGGRPVSATVKAIWNSTDFDQHAGQGRRVAVILDRTNHYAESGGQVGDRGRMLTDVFDLGASATRGGGGTPSTGDSRFEIDDTHQVGGYVLHIGRCVEGRLAVGDKVRVVVDRDRRRPTMMNHTGTHLLNHALRAVLGDDVEQRGSEVAPPRLRFDFTHSHAMTPEEVARVEELVNAAIGRAMNVYAADTPLEQAQRIHGVRAVFGERYPDPVRVVSIGQPVETLVADPENEAWFDHSVEFCGGTHLGATDEATRFVIEKEQSLATGIRRILAWTGPAAVAADMAAGAYEERIAEAEAADEATLPGLFDEIGGQIEHLHLGTTARHRLAGRVETLRTRVKEIRKQAQGAARGDVVEQARAIAERAAAEVIVEAIDGGDKETLLSAMDVIRAKCPEAATMLFAPDEAEGKVAIAAAVPKAMIKRGLKAGDWVREAAKVCGGGGGGKPDKAQAGGKDPAKVPEAVAAAREFAGSVLG